MHGLRDLTFQWPLNLWLLLLVPLLALTYFGLTARRRQSARHYAGFATAQRAAANAFWN